MDETWSESINKSKVGKIESELIRCMWEMEQE